MRRRTGRVEPRWARFIAFLTPGEGLHNHHEFPSSAKFALRGREIDPAWPVILFLEWCKMAKVHPEPIAKAA